MRQRAGKSRSSSCSSACARPHRLLVPGGEGGGLFLRGGEGGGLRRCCLQVGRLLRLAAVRGLWAHGGAVQEPRLRRCRLQVGRLPRKEAARGLWAHSEAVQGPPLLVQAQARDAGFTPQECSRGGYSLQDAKQAGYPWCDFERPTRCDFEIWNETYYHWESKFELWMEEVKDMTAEEVEDARARASARSNPYYHQVRGWGFQR